ncbi:TPA: hypothetical protein ACQRHU_005877 [Pseudomonas aeruginosa]|uniref:hypothetical protein n=1 Tax=Pseudomonas aeruginosa TaxID=287 RepID=UPI001D0AA932|nr:hypothetical protein [Pseudomonas aeruginosa]ELQ8316867.1 hypothetical protein [Pseudomonas aeruginosa]MCC0246419.1 hypothetical protein [Pseudomonas aeruginosa]HEJ3670526.1 hypothetical protein [Pseudomonas aeruginosa]HEJ3733367.1 hypothetical protein [Pseudomonas aeruginosa]
MSSSFSSLAGVPAQCTDCGSIDLSWSASTITTSGVQDGRLRLSEVQSQFVLGCNFCSETLAVLSGDRVADVLTAAHITSHQNCREGIQE